MNYLHRYGRQLARSAIVGWCYLHAFNVLAAGSPTVRIRAVGDTGFVRANGQFGTPPRGYVRKHLTHIASLLDGDFKVANLEGAVVARCDKFETKLFRFALAPTLLEQLAEFGFNAFALANNHALDCADDGSGGIASTDSTLQSVKTKYPNLVWHGVADTPQHLQLPTGATTIRGVRLGFLATTAWQLGAHARLGNRSNFASLAESLRRGPYDLRILSIHGGIESSRVAAKDVVLLAREFIDRYHGDIVFAHHPHVTQGIELLAKANGRYAIVFYSLGNFLHNGLGTSGDGLIARLNASTTGIDPWSINLVPLSSASTLPKPAIGQALVRAKAIIAGSSALLPRLVSSKIKHVDFHLEQSTPVGLTLLPQAVNPKLSLQSRDTINTSH